MIAPMVLVPRSTKLIPECVCWLVASQHRPRHQKVYIMAWAPSSESSLENPKPHIFNIRRNIHGRSQPVSRLVSQSVRERQRYFMSKMSSVPQPRRSCHTHTIPRELYFLQYLQTPNRPHRKTLKKTPTTTSCQHANTRKLSDSCTAATKKRIRGIQNLATAKQCDLNIAHSKPTTVS